MADSPTWMLACAHDRSRSQQFREATLKSLLGGALAAMIAMSAASAQTPLVSEDIMVKSPDAGIEIFVRNKRPANMTAFRPERTLVYVHGATYPASTAFDLKLGGLSWMEYIA